MHLLARAGSLILLTFLGVVPALAADETERNLGAFRARPLAPGVHLLRPAIERGSATNALVVERDDGILVVDAQPAPEAARELLAAIAQLSAKPIRFLVLSHPHAEALGGAGAFPEDVVVVASRAARDTLATPGYDPSAEMRDLAAVPAEYSPPPVRRPTLVVRAPTELDDPGNPVELLPLGPAHSAGDLLVHLPAAGVMYVGALMTPDRNPYAKDANVEGWMAALGQIARAAPAIVVPLRGPSGDLRDLRAERDALAWLRGRVDAALIGGTPTGEIPQQVLSDPGLAPNFDRSAAPSFLPSLIDRVLEEALTDLRKRRID